MAEYIDREAVIEILTQKQRAICPCGRLGPGYVYGSDRDKYYEIEADIDKVQNIPAADVVERKRGEWVGYPESFKFEHIYDRDAIVCPFCEVSWNIVDNDTESFNFCPNCGADLREDNNAKL